MVNEDFVYDPRGFLLFIGSQLVESRVVRVVHRVAPKERKKKETHFHRVCRRGRIDDKFQNADHRHTNQLQRTKKRRMNSPTL